MKAEGVDLDHVGTLISMTFKSGRTVPFIESPEYVPAALAYGF